MKTKISNHFNFTLGWTQVTKELGNHLFTKRLPHLYHKIKQLLI